MSAESPVRADSAYRFTPLDVAAYVKWSQLNFEQELKVLQVLWDLRKTRLDKRCGARFERFKRLVYDELYRLWSRGYVDEHSPLPQSLDLTRYPLGFFSAQQGALERYLILLALHLILTPHLPQINLHWSAVLRTCGPLKASKALWKKIVAALAAMHLVLTHPNGEAYAQDDFFADAEAVLRRASE